MNWRSPSFAPGSIRSVSRSKASARRSIKQIEQQRGEFHRERDGTVGQAVAERGGHGAEFRRAFDRERDDWRSRLRHARTNWQRSASRPASEHEELQQRIEALEEPSGRSFDPHSTGIRPARRCQRPPRGGTGRFALGSIPGSRFCARTVRSCPKETLRQARAQFRISGQGVRPPRRCRDAGDVRTRGPHDGSGARCRGNKRAFVDRRGGVKHPGTRLCHSSDSAGQCRKLLSSAGFNATTGLIVTSPRLRAAAAVPD